MPDMDVVFAIGTWHDGNRTFHNCVKIYFSIDISQSHRMPNLFLWTDSQRIIVDLRMLFVNADMSTSIQDDDSSNSNVSVVCS